ncbi:MAG: DUF4838 domain-containing protein [Lentisphaeria bacterium]|nr:DUF4838 domain-containing protein [Lentisphaeria bacterium]
MFNIYPTSGDSGVITAADELIHYGPKFFRCVQSQEKADIILHSENTSKFQDSFSLKSRGSKLYITGSNPRSVLFGVYEYLKKHGFAFLYPGREGEVIPENVVFRIDGFDFAETASRTFRGMAVAPDPDNLQEGYDLLRFMAQNKYNLFFMEGYDVDRPGDEYSVINGVHPLQHVEHSLKDKTWEERKEVALKKQTMIAEARKYGLLIERGGHGWNYGVPEHYGKNHGLTPEQARAELKAKGKINQRAEVEVSTWFQICLAREEVREIYAEHIISYLKKHRGELDIAAIWFGDGYDNKCMCEECIKHPFSDLYLDIFRRVALRAKQELPEITLECIMYFETLEPPTRNWLEGLDNVILNLAVWRHCYFHKLDDPACRMPGWIPDYRNNASHDTPNDKRIINYDHYLAYDGWRKIIGNDLKCLIFNYITMNRVPAAHLLSYDLTPLINVFDDYDRLNFDGMVDCQCHCSWDKPANLQLYGAGRVLWNKHDNDPAKIRSELFSLLFGKKSPEVTDYCDHMYSLLQECGNYHELLERTKDKAARLKAGVTVLKLELDSIGRLPSGREKWFRESLRSLQESAEICLQHPIL